MKVQDLISVVVPVYNVENYLKACIDSLLNQTYSDYELILIDDGSTDRSGKICDDYKIKDNRIKVIHKENRGLSSARNTGIDYANGKYITFIDSDDFVAPKYLEELYDSICDNGSQISLCDFKKVEENTEIDDLYIESSRHERVITLNSEEAIKSVYADQFHGIDFVAWAKLYKIELFIDTGIRYPEGRIHEDTFTTYKLFFEAETITYIDTTLYYYRIREGSIMMTEFSMKKLDMLVATREECDFFRNKGNKELLRLAFVDHLHKVKYIMHSINALQGDNKETMRGICADLKHDLAEYKDCISIPQYLYYRCLATTLGLFMQLR